MKGFNRVIIAGNLTSTPEVKTTPSNNKYTNFSIAINEKWRDKQGHEQQRVNYINCVLWGALADVIVRYCTKGSALLVEGKLQTRDYTDKNNIKRYVTEVLVSNVNLIGGRRDGTPGEAPPPHIPQGNGYTDQPYDYGYGSEPEPDVYIPF